MPFPHANRLGMGALLVLSFFIKPFLGQRVALSVGELAGILPRLPTAFQPWP